MNKHRIIVIKKSRLIFIGIAVLCIAALILVLCICGGDTAASYNENSEYVIFSMNDSGMHCMQEDYSGFLILPPGNTLKVQVFKKGEEEAKLITNGITVKYEMIDNTTSADKNNFWEYAKSYGYDVSKNIGITGNGLKGECMLSEDKKYFEAAAIPVVPYNDGSEKLNPYQTVKITVIENTSGRVLAQTSNTVIPVSSEMDCGDCHGAKNTDLKILASHDRLSKTNLVSDLEKGIRHKCAECHRDNAINEKGKADMLPLSQAMHGFHADKMTTETKPVCYSCHPGPVTQCYRGEMYVSGVKCGGENCHGDMANIALTQKNGRQAWVDEPDCGSCHGDKYSANKNILYRNSYLKNAPAGRMNGLIMCPSCHNSPHAEWKSSLAKDNLLPLGLLGYEDFINKCTVCHEGSGEFHR